MSRSATRGSTTSRASSWPSWSPRCWVVAEVVTPPDHVVDLRSDTVTKPSDDMRRAMASAEVGDDVYGEDPTLTRLEETVAGLLGHEAGVFTPSGSLANQLGLRLLVKPGQEVLADSLAHVLR